MIAFDIDGVMVDFVNEIFIPSAKSVLDRDIHVVSPGDYDFKTHLGISEF
jgi:hypothetical protein